MNSADLAQVLVASARADITPGTIAAIGTEGQLVVEIGGDGGFHCDFLDLGAASRPVLSVGDRVLVWRSPLLEHPVVVGRIGPYRATPDIASVTIEATQSLTLKCGDASLEMRADGKVMLKGDDVLIRAKGTQRIRAGNVAIN